MALPGGAGFAAAALIRRRMVATTLLPADILDQSLFVCVCV